VVVCATIWLTAFFMKSALQAPCRQHLKITKVLWPKSIFFFAKPSAGDVSPEGQPLE